MRCREFGMSGLKIKQSLAWQENLGEFFGSCTMECDFRRMNSRNTYDLRCKAKDCKLEDLFFFANNFSVEICNVI